MLQTRWGPDAQMGHNNFVGRDGGSLGCFCTVSGVVTALLYVTLWSRLYVYYIGTRKK